MKKYLFIVIMLVVSTGCSRRVTPPASHQVNDSSYVKETTQPHDSIIYSPVDSASIMALVHCPDGGVATFASPLTPLQKRGGLQAHVSLSLDSNGVLTAKCNCDGVEQKLHWQEKQTEYYKSHFEKDVAIQEKKHVPVLIQVLAYIGGAVMAGGIIYLLIKLKK